MGNEEVKLRGTVWMKTKVATSGGGVRMDDGNNNDRGLLSPGPNFRFIAAKKNDRI